MPLDFSEVGVNFKISMCFSLLQWSLSLEKAKKLSFGQDKKIRTHFLVDCTPLNGSPQQYGLSPTTPRMEAC
jgi:hypothetical protein